MSTISAGTTSGTALVNSGDTTGQLILQTNGTTTAVTIGTNQVVTLAQPLPVASGGTGSTATATAGGVGYGTGTAQAFTAAGTSGQALVSNGASAPTFGTLGVSGGGTGQTSLTANNVILGNGGSAVQFVAPGTNGNVLTSNGTTWTSAAAATGALVFLSSVTASNSSTIDLETGISSTYKQYMIVVSGYIPATGGTNLFCRMRISGTYQTSGYQYFLFRPSSNSSTVTVSNGTSQSEIVILSNQNGSGQNTGVVIYANNPAYTPSNPNSTSHMIYWKGASDGGNIQMAHGSGGFGGATAAVTGYRFLSSSGNISAGTFSLYGIANS